MEALETRTKQGLTAKLYQDDHAESPREFENLGTMYCEHNNYDLGDKGADDPRELDASQLIMLPLFLYDHSGLSMATGAFSCPWDSGQVGMIYVTKAKVRREYNVQRISANILDQVLNNLKSEVETYNQYLTGDVYGFNIDNKAGDCIDSCYGFFGYEYALEEMERALTDYLEIQREMKQDKLKALIKSHAPLYLRAETLAKY